MDCVLQISAIRSSSEQQLLSLCPVTPLNFSARGLIIKITTGACFIMLNEYSAPSRWQALSGRNGSRFSRSSPAASAASIPSFAPPVTTTNLHGWRFFAEGARIPALIISSTIQRGTGLSWYFRMLRRSVIAWIIIFFSFLIFLYLQVPQSHLCILCLILELVQIFENPVVVMNHPTSAAGFMEKLHQCLVVRAVYYILVSVYPDVSLLYSRFPSRSVSPIEKQITP